MAAWVFAMFVTIALSACMEEFTTERVADNSYAVGAYTVHETIDREDGYPSTLLFSSDDKGDNYVLDEG